MFLVCFQVCSHLCVQSVVVSSVCPVFSMSCLSGLRQEVCVLSLWLSAFPVLSTIRLQSWSWCFFPFLFPCTSLYVLSFYFPVPLSSSYVYPVCQCVLLPVLFLTHPQLICVMSPTDLCHIVVIYLPPTGRSVSPSSQFQPCLCFVSGVLHLGPHSHHTDSTSFSDGNTPDYESFLDAMWLTGKSKLIFGSYVFP